MSFLRHEEIYRSDVRPGYSWERQLVVAAPALIGCDEFPVGYSLAGCPPAEPASASPTGDDSQQSTLPYNDFSANGNYPLNFLSQSKGALHFYFLPSIVALARSKRDTLSIFFLNFFLGWTLVGWVIALIWAVKADDPHRVDRWS